MSAARAAVTTHVLDAASGRPAPGVRVTLVAVGVDGVTPVAVGSTDDDGRVLDLTGPDLPPGTYRITFATGEYFARLATPTFYPQVDITFTYDPAETGGHVHVPVLLAPYAFTTYRGS